MPNSSPSPPDDFPDFAVDESLAPPSARSAVPTDAEIDALFLDEDEIGSNPPASGSRAPRTQDTRLATIFGEDQGPILRDGIRGLARRGTELMRGWVASGLDLWWRKEPVLRNRIRVVSRSSLQAMRGWVAAATRLRWRPEPARRTLLDGPVDFAHARLSDRAAERDAPRAGITAGPQPVLDPPAGGSAHSTHPSAPPPIAEPPEDSRRQASLRSMPLPRTLEPPKGKPAPVRPRRPPKPVPPRDVGPASWTQVALMTGILSLAAFISVVGLAELASNGWSLTRRDSASGSLTVTTEPAGARVIVDGTEVGVTPATLTVPAGEHILEVRTADVSKTLPLSVAAGAELSRAFDLNTRARPGRLDIRTNPAGAQVFVDGRHRGRSPLTLSELSPGPHAVLVQRSTQSAEQVVNVEPGATAAVTLTLAEATAATSGRSSGWLSVPAPMELEVFEGDRRVGVTRAGRLELPAGRRELEFVNETFGVRVRRAVDVAGGRTTALALEIPPGVVTINAIPWADVRLDGRLIGRTPLADLKVAAGRHDLLFRHPQNGQRRLTIQVTAGEPLVVTTDLRK